MIFHKAHKFAIVAAVSALLTACFNIETQPEQQNDFSQITSIEVESRTCDRITAILPNRGRYDGISLKRGDKFGVEWLLSFKHVAYRNEKPSGIGLLTLDDVAKIADLILERGVCENPPYVSRHFESGDKFLLSVDLWLVEDLYQTAVEVTENYTEGQDGIMLIKPLRHPSVQRRFTEAGFADRMCSVLSETNYPCSIQHCLESLITQPAGVCEGKWMTAIYPYYNAEVKDLPKKDVCKIENCGLEKESTFSIELVKR